MLFRSPANNPLREGLQFVASDDLLRDDVRQCLIVAPGGLVEQWQDELFFKFGLRFDLLTNQLIDANVNLNVFETNPAEAAELFNLKLAAYLLLLGVLPSVLLPYGLLLLMHNLIPRRMRLPQSRWALLIIILVLGSKPYRATYRDLSSFLPGPTRSGLHNSFNAFAFYGVRLAFRPAEALPSPCLNVTPRSKT